VLLAPVSSRMSRVRRTLDDLRTVAAMPRIEIVLSRGRPDEEELLRLFRRRHPSYKVVGRKVVGVALLPLDQFADVDAYLADRRTTRRRTGRARRLGYTVDVFDPNERRSELLAIHASMPERQGRPIDADYLEADAIYETGPHIDYVGVFRDGVVIAYSRLQYAGDIAGMPRIMGHGDHLANGVMFLLGAGIVEHVKTARPEARYLMYDMFFGASAGLREFKTHLGFRPHYVRWKREPAPSRVASST
jgi:hypothetical protein